MEKKMKLSCLPVSLFSELVSGKMTIPQWAQAAKDMGLDGFDISMMFLRNHTPVYLRQLREELEKIGMPIIMACTYPDLVHPDPVQRDREMEYLRHDIAICSQLGVRYLRVLAGQDHPELTREQGIALAISGLRQAAPIADKYGVQLVYEDHAKPGAWDYIDFSFQPDIFLEIAQGIRDTSVGINYDTANITAAGWETMPVLEAVFDKIKTIHVADTAEFAKFRPVMIGTGATPIPEVFSYLKKNGFDGWFCIEEASNTGMEGVAEAVRRTRQIWENA